MFRHVQDLRYKLKELKFFSTNSILKSNTDNKTTKHIHSVCKNICEKHGEVYSKTRGSIFNNMESLTVHYSNEFDSCVRILEANRDNIKSKLKTLENDRTNFILIINKMNGLIDLEVNPTGESAKI